MTDAEHAAWQGYFRLMADALDLRDWDVTLLREPCADEYGATIKCIEGKRVANAQVHRNWERLKPHEAEDYVVHECTHPHFAACREFVYQQVARYMSAREFELFWGTFTLLFEYGIDGVAKVIQARPVLPPPPNGSTEAGPKLKKKSKGEK
jgi:hypothetical protein